MRRAIEFLVVVALMVAVTWLVAWWGVAAIAALWALARRADRGLALNAGVAGMLSWIVILLFAASADAIRRTAQVAGTAMGVGSTALLILVMAYPALLASSAAALVRATLSIVLDRRTRTGSRAGAYRPARPVGR